MGALGSLIVNQGPYLMLAMVLGLIVILAVIWSVMSVVTQVRQSPDTQYELSQLKRFEEHRKHLPGLTWSAYRDTYI